MMTDEESKQFKSMCALPIQQAIAANGGIDALREMHALIGEQTISFIAGYAMAQLFHVHAKKSLSQEEIRRLFDLVRLRFDTDSMTS